MSMVLDTKKSNFGNQQFSRFIFGSFYKMRFIIKCIRLYYKMWQLFYYKMLQRFMKKFFRFFLKSAAFYYKMQQLLQNPCMLLQNATVTEKCTIYYKMLRYIDHSQVPKHAYAFTVLLPHLLPMHSFPTPWKGFLMFWGGKKRMHWVNRHIKY